MNLDRFTIFKEYCPSAGFAIIRTNTYTKTAEFFQALIAIAKQDFVAIDNASIEVNFYKNPNGNGIEFKVLDKPNNSYRLIESMPMFR